MKPTVLEKGDGSITIKYVAENGHEAMILAMATMTVRENSRTGLETNNSYGNGKGLVVIGSTTLNVLDTLATKPPEEIPF